MKFFKLLFLTFFLIQCVSLSSSAFKRKKKKYTAVVAFNYEAEFRKVDSLLFQVDQPKSALLLLNDIQQHASLDAQNGYYIRCVQYRVALIRNETEADDTLAPAWKLLQSEILKGTEDIKAFLSIDAAMYLKDIYEENRWLTDRFKDDKSNNPKNWSTGHLNQSILQFVDDALKFSNSETIHFNPIYEPLISNFTRNDFKLSVYQVLLRNAIEIIDNLEVENNAEDVSPKAEDVLIPFNEFINKKFITSNDPKNKYKRLQLYQVLLNSLLSNSSKDKENKIIYFEIERLSNLRIDFNDDSKYCSALEQLYNQYSENTYSNLIAEKMAEYYQNSHPVKAMAIIQKALSKHPRFLNESSLINIKNTIENIEISVQTERVNQAGQKILGQIEYKNLHQVFVTAYKFDYIDFIKQSANNSLNDPTSVLNYLEVNQSIVKSYSIQLPMYSDYQNHTVEVAFDSLPWGHYMLLVSSTLNVLDTSAKTTFGRISIAHYTIVKIGEELFLKNAVNGTSFVNESYKVFREGYYRMDEKTSYEKLYEGTTNNSGLIDLSAIKSKNRYEQVLIEIGNHILYESHYIYDNTDGNSSEQTPITKYKVITDRSIYRPGQKVYFKCIAYDYNNQKVIPNKKVTVILQDNNSREEKGKLNLLSNQFGSVSGQFILPTGGFNTGDFSISVNNEFGVYFKVEEYKRPKYEAKFLVPQQAFKLNDEVALIGEAKAFAGYGVQGAEVKYTVTRKLKPTYLPWWYFRSENVNRGEQVTILTGSTKTDSDGKFSLKFKAMPDENEKNSSDPYFIFEIEAFLKDLNGEIKTCTYSMTISATDQQLTISANENNALGRSLVLNYSVTNLLNQPLSLTGSITIEKIIEKNEVYRERLWTKSDTSNISENDFNLWFPSYRLKNTKPEQKIILTKLFSNDNNKHLNIAANAINEAGTYFATIKSIDGRGKEISSACQFKLMPQTSGPFLLPEALSMQCINGQSFEPSSKALLWIGSGLKNTMVKIIVKSNRGLILEKEIQLNQSSQTIVIPITAADRGNIHAIAYTVNNYRLYTTSQIITVPYSNKELKIQLSSFRNETEPGAKEKWIIKLKGPAAEKAAMESVAVMYDQSLDAIYTNANWKLWIYENYYQSDNISSIFESHYFNLIYEGEYWQNYGNYQPYYFRIPMYNSYYGRLNETTISYNYSDNTSISKGYGRGGGAGAKYFEVEKTSIASEGSYKKSESKNDEVIPKSEALSIRKNFSETVFFYPHLITNSKGEIILEFTMPEALTQWKMRMLSHSTAMQTGYFEQSITTSKKVMVQPNVPRFLRHGDAINLTAKIINTTKANIVAKVNFSLINDATGLPLNWNQGNNIAMVNVPANGSEPISFSLLIPDFIGNVTISYSISSGNFTDGEQHTIPVLSKRLLLTESMPITIRNKGEQILQFNSLINNKSTTIVNENLSLEMCNNPAWYAVQSLPYLMEFPHECAEQIFTRLYANSIAVQLANSNPSIKKTFETWERQTASDKNLQSKLSLNQDVKNIIIEETPWQYEAKNETERIQKLGVLFNSQKLNEELQYAYEKLKNMQLDNGAFGWFKGMQANAYITQTIVIGFGKMKRMGIDISKYQSIIAQAISYLDAEATKDYHYYHQHKELNHFYPSNLQYLYCKSYFPLLGLSSNDTILQYFIQNSEKTWTGNALLNRAQLCIALRILSPTSNIPHLILKSFTENAVQNNETGMYWSGNKAGYNWYEAPIETQAAIIEAYSGTEGSANQIKEQQIWLLRQKQTQNWGTTRSTADACYALLMHGNSLNSKQMVKVTVNDKLIKPSRTEEGTGYFREKLPKETINSKSGMIKVDAATDDFAYGAIYWQYFEEMDKIQTTGSGLSISKKIFKNEITSNGINKKEITAAEIKVGDIIEISLNISCDRNLEFIHIKDLRGSGTEPVDVLSGCRWQQNGLVYYQSTRDAATHFFIDNMAKGNYQINYSLKVEQSGNYNSGVASIQCMYAPEYSAHSKGTIMKVGE